MIKKDLQVKKEENKTMCVTEKLLRLKLFANEEAIKEEMQTF